MLSASRTCAVVLSAIFLPVAGTAYADTISISISGTGSGSLAGQSFNQQLVTFTGQTTSAEVTACASHTATDGCTYFANAFQREYLIPYTGGTVSIGGMGTYTVAGPELIDFFAGVYDPEQIRLGAPGSAGGLTFGATMPGVPYDYNFGQSLTWTGGPQGSFVDAECFSGPPSQCQYFAATTGGELRLTTLFPQVNGEIAVTPGLTAVAPEPGAWLLAGTGALAGLSILRRRLLL